MVVSEQLKKKIADLPDQPGCYLMRDETGKIIYIGKAISLKNRVRTYFKAYTKKRASAKTRSLMQAIADFDLILLNSNEEAILKEGELIKQYKPYYNVLWKDDKQFLLIRIDIENPFPVITLARQKTHSKSLYFGPFIHGRAAHAAVDFIQRNFGLKRCRVSVPKEEHYRHCSDDIIANCSAPCVQHITPEAYRERVQEAISFLKGERMDLLMALRAEMRTKSDEKAFEEAAALRDLYRDLETTIKERAKVKKTPSLVKQETELGLIELQKALKLSGIPRVIECFDISNISGTQSVGSMVVSISGKPYPQRYRRYKIKEVSGIDDPRSIAETVFRRYDRLRREQQPFPDLIIVDGGITQLRAAKRALRDIELSHLPIIGLAKRHEDIVTDEDHLPRTIRLQSYSAGRRLITLLRDEAHRYALSYHRKLRAKRIQESILDSIPGIGNTKKRAILNYFGSIQRLKKADIKELANVPGIGRKTAEHIMVGLKRAG